MLSQFLIASTVLYTGVKVYSKKRRNKALIDYIKPPEMHISWPNETPIPILGRVQQFYRQMNPSNQESKTMANRVFIQKRGKSDPR